MLAEQMVLSLPMVLAGSFWPANACVKGHCLVAGSKWELEEGVWAVIPSKSNELKDAVLRKISRFVGGPVTRRLFF